MLIDTHCHLDFKDFDSDREDVVRRALKAGVGRIINVGSSLEGSRRSVALAEKYEFVYASVGIHPHDAKAVDKDALAEIEAFAENEKVVAIGEVGLDYYRNLSPKQAQIDVFRQFIRLAKKLTLPIIVHSREAHDDTCAILREELGSEARGVIHCFSGDAGFLKRCLEMGFYISFTGNLTFKNAPHLPELAKLVRIERVLLETDAPFLAPQSHRGQRNEPAYLTYIAESWVKLTGLSKDDIERITSHNANRLFGLGLDESSRIAYPIRESLYLNITNRCTNACSFCVRADTDFVKGHHLRLDSEPSADELWRAIGDPLAYKEIVFCGYGEPTIRLDAVKEIARRVKERGGAVRLVTNGHADLIQKRRVAPELKGLIDRMSVSLNAENAAKYEKICRPEFGEGSYEAVLDFIRSAVGQGIKVELTCLDIPGIDVKKCEETALSLGASFRLRHFGVVG